jgi:hypothetical protein
MHQGLWFEISDEIRGRREFVITAGGGAPTLVRLVDAVVAAAPAIGASVSAAVKPAIGFDFATTYEGIAFDSKSLWLMPLESSDDCAYLGLRIGILGPNDEMQPVAENAIMVILDIGLGGRSSALDVQQVEFAELLSQPEQEGYIELPELPAHIAWRKRKLANGCSPRSLSRYPANVAVITPRHAGGRAAPSLALNGPPGSSAHPSFSKDNASHLTPPWRPNHQPSPPRT